MPGVVNIVADVKKTITPPSNRDNEAVQALASPRHPKHQRVLGYMEAVERRKRHAMAISLSVPAAVRVEAGWDRTAARWAFLNRLRIMDVSLDAAHTNAAAAIHEL
jgi:hypothetical protein